jgi:hypothetical protein
MCGMWFGILDCYFVNLVGWSQDFLIYLHPSTVGAAPLKP